MKKEMIIMSFPEVSAIGKKVASVLNVPHSRIQVHEFPDGEYNLKFRKNPRGKKVVIVSCLAREPNKRMIECMLAAGIARDFKAKEVILVATYLPYMRQDTHFSGYDSFSAKHFLEAFSDYDKIIAIDPHLHRIKNMHFISKKAESISANATVAYYIKKKFKDDFTIIGPDAESAQWSAKIAKMLNKKVVILEKTRFGDKHIKQKEKKLGEGGTYIIIDDIISTGRTLAGALEMAKNQGAKRLVCIGIHGLLLGDAAKLVRKHAQLITTNTIPNKYAKIDVSVLIAHKLIEEN